MNTTRHRLLLLGAAFAAIAAIVTWQSTKNSVQRSDSAGTATSDRSQTPVDKRLWQGARSILAPSSQAEHYTVDYQGAMTPMTGSHGAEGPAKVGLKGRLEVAQFAAAGDGWMAARLTDGAATANALALRLVGEGDVARALLNPWAFKVGAAGRVTAVKFPAGTPTGAQTMAATMTYALQFVRSEQGAPEAGWVVQETDVNGPYRASYSPLADGDGFLKTWTLSAQDAPQNQAAAMGASHRSQVRYDFDGRGGLRRLSFQQTGMFQLALAGVRGPEAPFGTTVMLEHRRRSSADWISGLRLASLRDFGADQLTAQAAPPAASDKSPEQLIAAASTSGHRADLHRRSAIRDQMTVALRADDALAASFAKGLAEGSFNEPASRTMIEALASAGTPSAERAIIGLVGAESTSPNLRGRLLVAATLMTQPSAQYVSALTMLMRQALTGERASHVAVALGGAANALGDIEPERAAAIVDNLVAAATGRLTGGGVELPAVAHERDDERTPGDRSRPPTMTERMQWVAALGNTGSPAAREAIVRTLDDSMQPVRVAAAYALRLQDPATTLTVMAEHMAKETSGAVREALVSAGRTMGPAALPLVKKALFADANESVRLEAAYAVAAWNINAPGMRQLLGEALAKETSPVVRESLKNYMAPGRVAAPFRTVEAAVASEGTEVAP